MDKFTTLEGIAAPLIVPNVTTDALSPSAANRSAATDLGAMLFADWRYELDGSEKPDFVLNREPFRHAKILVGGANFGCGSSRERAVWALAKFGIRCVIAPGFADIFRSNCFQNGVLPVELADPEFAVIRGHVEGDAAPRLLVDLTRSEITLPGGQRIGFTIPEFRRHALLNGLDDIDMLLSFAPEIEAFRAADSQRRPWVYAVS